MSKYLNVPTQGSSKPKVVTWHEFLSLHNDWKYEVLSSRHLILENVELIVQYWPPIHINEFVRP